MQGGSGQGDQLVAAEGLGAHLEPVDADGREGIKQGQVVVVGDRYGALTLGAIAYLILFIPVVWFGRWVETSR